MIKPLENWLHGFPLVWKRMNRDSSPVTKVDNSLHNHVVIVGYGRVGQHIVNVLNFLKIPQLVIEMDSRRIAALHKESISTLFGDAANSELLRHAGLNRARVLVVTVPDEASTGLIVSAARQLNGNLPIVARAITQNGIQRLSDLGADDVIHPELEGGLEILRYTLVRLGMPLHLVEKYTDTALRDHYDTAITSSEEHRVLRQLIDASQGMEISWFPIEKSNALIGQTLASANIRARTGASVIAIMRGGNVIANPKSITEFKAADNIGLIGDAGQISNAEKIYFTPTDN